jgi:small subunit ribosomal protein S17
MSEVKQSTRGTRKERKGVVIRRSGDKTVIVRVERRKRHELYGKVMNLSAKFHVHDEKNVAKVGDLVRIVETRPLSRLKRWRVTEVIQAARATA